MSDDVPPPKPFRIGGLSLPRKVVYGVAVVALYVGGAAFAVGYANRDKAPAPAPTTTAAASQMSRCWDGAKVTRGTRCSTDYDATVLFWAFGIDANKVICERAPVYRWSEIGLNCEYGKDELRMAIWLTPELRDSRLVAYGKASSIGRGLLRHVPGEAERTLVRYDSDQALLYASVKDGDSELLDELIPTMRSRTELLYGATVTARTPSATPTR